MNDRFMNDRMPDWDDLRLFLAVARDGGLARAATSTGKSAPTLGRRMLALERGLGQELFVRLPRGYGLTDQGADLLARATHIEAQMDTVLRPPEAGARMIVKISAGMWMTHLLCAHAPEILGDADDINLRFIAADHTLDIGRREAVIGLRNQRPEGIGLACQRVGRVRFAGYAVAPDVSGWIGVTGTTPSARWLSAQGGHVVEVTSARNVVDLALAGVARALLPTRVGARVNGLVQVSDPVAELDHDQWLVSHHEDRFLPPVRRVLTRIKAALQSIHDPAQ